MTREQLSSEMLRAFFEQVDVGVLVLCAERPGIPESLRMVVSNPAAERYLRTPIASLHGMLLKECFPMVFETTDWPNRYIEVIRTGQSQDIGEVLYGDERVPNSVFSLRAVPLGAQHVALLYENITERKESEELRERLHHQDRLAAIGQLSAEVAHEINNPAAYVIANLDLLAEHIAALTDAVTKIRLSDDSFSKRVLEEYRAGAALDQAREMLTESSGGMHRIMATAKSLRVFSRVEHAEIELVEINEVVNAACKMVYNEIRHRACLVKELGQVPPIAADKGKLTQVITNLLVNAAHSIPAGAADRNRIKVVTSRDERNLLLRIQDTGDGVPERIRAQIFQPFFSTKASDRGTGLGLSISREIVAYHGGTLQLENREDQEQGSTFLVSLPIDTGLEVTPVSSPTMSK